MTPSPATAHQRCVPRLWVILDAACPAELEEPSITAWDLLVGAYVEVGHAVGDESLTATQPFPVTIVASTLVS